VRAGSADPAAVAVEALADEQDLQKTLASIDAELLGRRFEVAKGKVRDWVDLGDRLLLVTTDRVSAFDRVLTTIPLKGEVLNQMSLFWFDATAHIAANHVVRAVTPRSVLVDKCVVIPIEVVVRGYLTGSAYRDYERSGVVSGIQLPVGMLFNQRFERPLLTPQTKAARGEHDMAISRQQLLARDLVKQDVWETVETLAMQLYEFGARAAAKQGLILVDTKYEFGVRDGEIVLADEVHTPDSSRYWYADSYEELFRAGEKQRKLDKEYLRQWLMERGFTGDGEPPLLPASVRLQVANRYCHAYRLVTGKPFAPARLSPAEEHRQLAAALAI
jgi:phosphoribosylaminoimidazole-succinocarboxamide synthase